VAQDFFWPDSLQPSNQTYHNNEGSTANSSGSSSSSSSQVRLNSQQLKYQRWLWGSYSFCHEEVVLFQLEEIMFFKMPHVREKCHFQCKWWKEQWFFPPLVGSPVVIIDITMLYIGLKSYSVACVNSLPRTHLRGGDCSTSFVEPNVNSYTQTRPPLVPTHRVGKERSTKHSIQ